MKRFPPHFSLVKGLLPAVAVALLAGVPAVWAQTQLECPIEEPGVCVNCNNNWCGCSVEFIYPPGVCEGCSSGLAFFESDTCWNGSAGQSPDCCLTSCGWTTYWEVHCEADVEQPSEPPPPCERACPTTQGDCHQGPALPVAGPPTQGGKPISLTTGDMFFTHTDAVVGKLAVTRTFHTARLSLAGRYGSFGPGWNASFDVRLNVVSPKTIEARLSDGSAQYYFDPEANGIYEAVLPYSRDSWIDANQGGLRRMFRIGGQETYDTSGKLLSVTETSGVTTTFTRDAQGRLSSVTRLGRSFSISYLGASTRPHQLLDPVGAVLATYSYDASNRLETVTYPDGSGYQHTYNAAGQITAVADLGGKKIEAHEYDGSGRATTSEIGDGIEKLTFSYAANRTTVTDALSNVATYDFVNVRGTRRVTKVTGPCSSCGGGGGDVQEWTYDDDGNIASYKDGAGNLTSYVWDGSGNLTKITDALNQVTEFQYDAQGRVTRRWEPGTPLGAETTWTYVAAGPATITETVRRTPSLETRTTTIAYNAQGQPQFITDPRGKTTELSYTAAGDLDWIEDPMNHRTNFEYDVMGRRELTILPPTPASPTQEPRTTYDVRGRVKRITNPNGSYTEFTYDEGGRRETVRDPLGRITTYVYDLYGRLEKVIDPLLNETLYGYDAMSNLTSLINARGHETEFRYDDGHNRVTKIVYPPDGREEMFTYDAAGRLWKKTDRKGVTTTFSYDALSRPTGKSYSNGAASVSYGYDRRGLTSAVNSVDTVTRAYDLAGQLRTESSSKNASTVEYEYDPAGNRITLKLDGTVEAEYIYDDAGRLDEVKRGTKTFNPVYDDASRRTSLAYPNGVLATYTYDLLSRLTKVENKKGSTLIAKAEYPTFDDADNRLEKNTHDISEDYTYDELYRLKTVLRGSTTTEDYSYDDVGNRRPTGSTGWDFNERNELTATPSLTLAYDLNGNRITRTGGANAWTYTWSVENELTKVRKDGVDVGVFKYDALGRRVEKVAGGITYKYTYDGEDVLRQKENDGTSQLTRRFIHGPGVDEPWARFTGTAFTYYHADGLASVLKITNNAGTVDASYRYNAFGEIEVGQSREGYSYTGREWDPETKLYYYRARYYEPQLGRFLSEDPSRVWSWLNLYAYVENNPVNFTDPLGLMKVKQGVAVPTGPLLVNLQCLEECLGSDLEIRVTETTGRHPPRNPHTRGLAADFTVGPRDPFIDPKRPVSAGASARDVLCCARACGFQFSQFEGPGTPGATAPHFHSQIPPGRGGAVKPTQTQCCTP